MSLFTNEMLRVNINFYLIFIVNSAFYRIHGIQSQMYVTHKYLYTF